MEFLDANLARRLETADACFKASYTEAQINQRPDLHAAIEQLADACAVYAGPGSPLNRAVGLGMNGPVSTEVLERVERFFHSRETPSRIELCPLADPSLSEWLNHKGYRLAEFKNAWILPLRGDETFPPPPSGIEVRAARPTEADLWIRTVTQGFAGRDDVTPADQVIATPNFYMSTATCFLAWQDDEPLAGGVMAIHQGLVSFFSASTRPAFRGRGAQTALLHARLAAAVAAGCDLALVHTSPGNASQRNVQRLGFRLAYTKLALVREPA